VPTGDSYRLLALSTAPPALEQAALIDPAHLGGWWDGGWHVLALPKP